MLAGVHDSYWTHACDVDEMNRILREKFVELYETPILENVCGLIALSLYPMIVFSTLFFISCFLICEQLLESFQESFPSLTFPPLPERGEFDLREVLESPYFFN